MDTRSQTRSYAFVCPVRLSSQNCEKVDRLDGAHAPELTKKVQKLAPSGAAPPRGAEPPKEDLNDRLKKLLNAAPCMLFMKGSPQEPRCGKRARGAGRERVRV